MTESNSVVRVCHIDIIDAVLLSPTTRPVPKYDRCGVVNVDESDTFRVTTIIMMTRMISLSGATVATPV